MNLIPDINLFIVTSSLKPNMGAYSDGDRFNQTIDSLKSLREKVPEAIVLFTDCSARPVSDLEKQAISKYSKDRKSTRLNSSHSQQSRMPSSA